MYYIVRAWDEYQADEYQYDTLEEAQAQMSDEQRHAELFVWLDGREEFIGSVN